MQALHLRHSLTACAALFLVSPAIAQETVYGASGGDLLFGLSGSYRYAHAETPSSSADEAEAFVARGNMSWFLERAHELGMEASPSVFRNELGGSSFDLYLGGYYNYNLWTSPQMNFYFGPQIGFLRTDPSGGDTDTAFSFGAHVGVRYWIDPRVSIDIEPRFSFTSLDESLGGDERVFDILFGLSVRV